MGTHPIFESDFDCLTDLRCLTGVVSRRPSCAICAVVATRNHPLPHRNRNRRQQKVAPTNEGSGKQCESPKPTVVSQANENKSTTDAIHASQPNEELPELITEEAAIDEKKKLEIADVNRVQKEMEEKNKRRRAALAQEVQSRQRKAAIESKMLKTIEDELAKLDQLLNADVSVLRDQIDVACCEFSDARRRFELAEKEYVDSKLDLQKKTETKENLTDHLVSLIQMNEERKQKKLEELTFKLSMDPEVVAQREAEAAKKLREEEEAERKRKEEERNKRLEEEEKLKKAKEEEENAKEEEEAKSEQAPPSETPPEPSQAGEQ